MATKKQSRKESTSKAAVARALEYVGCAHDPLYTIEALGESYTGRKPCLSVQTLNGAIAPICGKVRDYFAEAGDCIAHLRHPATEFLDEAAGALDRLACLLEVMEETSYGQLADVPPRLYCATLGKGILAFVAECGRWMERAEEALGDKGPLSGWLALEHVDGLPEGEFIRVDAQEKWVAREFSGLNQNARAQVADFIAAAKRAQSNQ